MCDIYIEMEIDIINGFNEFNLNNGIMKALERMNFTEPSKVQEIAIMPMLEGKDLLVQAPTGTGKTAAFSIPMLQNIDANNSHIQKVILCPTRELAMQTVEVLRDLTVFMDGIRVLALYGGEPIINQIRVLKRHPQIIVATPGRLMDHMDRRTVRLDSVDLVVLDEADCMLDMGFRDDIKKILDKVPTERQTVLFSATVSNEIRKIAETYQKDVENITIKQNSLAVDKVEQYYSEMKGANKIPSLINLLNEKNFNLSLVFVATKAMADKLSNQLNAAKFSADAIHGDLRQKQRDAVMKKYRDGRLNILVATDIAARGIDVGGIDAVINFDVPCDSESYVHRIGRTGRADKTGVAYTFISSKQRGRIKDIVRATNANISPLKIKSDILESFSLDNRVKNTEENSYKRRSDSSKSDARRSDERRSYGNKSDNSKSDYKKSESRKTYGRKSDDRRNDDIKAYGRKSEDVRSFGRKSEDAKSFGRKNNDRKNDDVRSFEKPNKEAYNKNSDDKRSYSKKSDSRKSEGRSYKAENKSSESKNFSTFQGKSKGRKSSNKARTPSRKSFAYA